VAVFIDVVYPPLVFLTINIPSDELKTLFLLWSSTFFLICQKFLTPRFLGRHGWKHYM